MSNRHLFPPMNLHTYRLGVSVLLLACIGCAPQSAPAPHLQNYGAKFSKRDNGVVIDLRNAPDFDDQAMDLLSDYSDQVIDLTLQNVTISDSGIEKLAPLTKVGRLILNDTPITGAGLANLTVLPLHETLWNLGLKNTAIADRDVKLLANFPLLKRIDLTGTQVSDVGLKDIPDLDWGRINLKATKVTEKGVMQLREAFPKAEIVF